MSSSSSGRVFGLLGSTAVLAALIVACGGTTSSPSDMTDASASDGASPGSDAHDAGDGAVVLVDGASTDAASGCIELPAEGTACAPGQVSCDRVDLCCASAAQCDPTTSKWKLSGNACLLCESRPCGDKTCTGNQLCLARASGVSGGATSYECTAYPTACAREWTCACVEKNAPNCTLVPGGCSDTVFPVKLSCMGI